MNQSLEGRVAILEKNIRFYRYSFLAVFVIAAGLVFMSFNNRQQAPDLIQAKRFQVVDEYNNVLVELSKQYGNGHVATFSPAGKKLVALMTSEGGAGGINTFDNDGEVIFKVTRTVQGGGYMALFNSQRKEIAEWGVSNAESGYFRLNDRYGEKMAWMTYTEGGGGYFSLSNRGTEMFRLSTPDAGGRIGVYNGYNSRIAYIGAQDNRDGNITIWSSNGTRTGGLP